VLTVLVAVCAQMFATIGVERRAAEKRTLALQEAANVVEQISSLPWDEINETRLATIVMSPSAQETLVGGTVKINLEPVAGLPMAKHVRVEIGWPNGLPGTAAPVQLDYWAYASKGAAAP